MDPRILREATRAEHEATEALMPLTAPGLTRETYVRTLETLQVVVESWEAWALEAAPEGLRSMVAARRRAALLRADLAMFAATQTSLGAFPGQVTGDSALDWEAVVRGNIGPGTSREAEFEAAFLGAMYVMEGSSLGGRYLARHVESVLGLEPGQGNAYFQGYGEATGAMWREVTARIGTVPESLAPVVIEAARRTFRLFGEVLRAGRCASLPLQR